MFNISWDGECAHYCCVFDDGWKRLNSCRAGTYHKKSFDVDSQNGVGYVTYCDYLVSYATPIMQIYTVYRDDGYRISTSINVNDIQWNCSRTTVSHVRKFIDAVNFFGKGIGCESDVILYALKNASKEGMTENVIKPTARVNIYPVAPSLMHQLFERDCPWFG